VPIPTQPERRNVAPNAAATARANAMETRYILGTRKTWRDHPRQMLRNP
jgi:hypothetical protein